MLIKVMREVKGLVQAAELEMEKFFGCHKLFCNTGAQ
jgi:hypothetical protein